MCVSTATCASKMEAGKTGAEGCRGTGGCCDRGSQSRWAGLCHCLQCRILCTSLSCSSWLLHSCLCSWFLCAWLIGYGVIFKSDFDKTLENVSIAQDWKWPQSLSCFCICHVVLLSSSTHEVSVCFLKTTFFCKRKTSITALKIPQKVYLWSVWFLNIKSPYVLQNPAISKA